MTSAPTTLVDDLESNIRGYCRQFPVVFQSACGSRLVDQDGRSYIDFFAGAGALNYGHNNANAKQALLEYLQADGVMHSLDMTTTSKLKFLETFQDVILKPRSMDYRVQFTGPTGTNAVEAALKLARKVTGRRHVVAFTRAYHGHTAGALAVTANSYYQHESYGGRDDVSHLPFDGYLGASVDTADFLARYLDDPSSGMPTPAAVILETIQGEGGVHVASNAWLRRVAEICRVRGVLLIVDEIQVGNGRSGAYFSFESAGIKPDIICLSKSIGAGLPLSLVLIREELDQWKPGEHTGTFRGNNLAFVAGEAVLHHWQDPSFVAGLEQKAATIESWAQRLKREHEVIVRGRGLIWGIDFGKPGLAREIANDAFRHGLVIETAGAHDEVIKLLPPLTIEESDLVAGLRILRNSIDQLLLGETLIRLCANEDWSVEASSRAGHSHDVPSPQQQLV
ncbi:MAG: diaminobutyrate--2-oxoglutarate transaminase [Planctomycetota bacterium]